MNFTRIAALLFPLLVLPFAVSHAQTYTVVEEVPQLLVDDTSSTPPDASKDDAPVTTTEDGEAPAPDVDEESPKDGDEQTTADGTLVVGIDETGDLTQDEFNTLTTTADIFTLNVLETASLMDVRIVAINEADGTVIVEASDGTTYAVDRAVFTAAATRIGGGALLNPTPGTHVILTAPGVAITAAELEVSTDNGDKNVEIFIFNDGERVRVDTTSIPVYRNGTRTPVTALNAGDSVTVSQKENGDVLAVYATAEEGTEAATTTPMKESSSRYLYLLVGVTILAIALYMLRPKKSSTGQ